jgi:hypothetical protein
VVLKELHPTKKTVVFSVHSIEQIPFLPDNYFDELLKIPGLSKGIHFEPVGWQINNEQKESSLDKEFKDTVVNKSHYNQNFYDLISSAEKKGLINILEVRKNIMGQNTVNPTTIMTWEPAKVR